MEGILDWNKDRRPNPGETSLFGEDAKFRRGLYRLADGVYAWMQPNGSWGESNSGIISSNGETLVFDSLFDLIMTRRMIDALQPIIKHAPVRQLVNGHADGDHTYGNQLFPGAEIIASKSCAHDISQDNPKVAAAMPTIGKVLSCCGLGGLPIWPLAHLHDVGRYFRGVLRPFDFAGIDITVPTTTFSGAMTGHIGNIEYRLIEVGPAHTDGDVLLYLPEQKVLFASDVVFIDGTPACHSLDVENWIAALEVIQSLDVEYIVPGHGPIVGADGLDDLKTYLNLLCVKVPDKLNNGMKPHQAGRQLLFDDTDFAAFRHWDSPERTIGNVYPFVQRADGKGNEHMDKKYLFKGAYHGALAAFELDKRPPPLLWYT